MNLAVVGYCCICWFVVVILQIISLPWDTDTFSCNVRRTLVFSSHHVSLTVMLSSCALVLTHCTCPWDARNPSYQRNITLVIHSFTPASRKMHVFHILAPRNRTGSMRLLLGRNAWTVYDRTRIRTRGTTPRIDFGPEYKCTWHYRVVDVVTAKQNKDERRDTDTT